MIKYTNKNQVRKERAYFGLQFQRDRLHNGREGMAAEGIDRLHHGREGVATRPPDSQET